jgi:PAS domain S-box-containing protein
MIRDSRSTHEAKPMLPSVSMQQIIDNIPVVIFEYTVFPDGTREFTYLSPGCESILGISREILLQGLAPFKSFIFRDDWNSFSSAFERTISEVSAFKWEGRVITPKSEIKWIEVTSVPVIMEGGKIAWSGVISDIRQRKELEQKQKESDLRYRNLVESIPLGMGIHQNGKLVFVNEFAVQMMGAKSADEMVGRSVLDFVHPDNRSWIVERMRAVMSGHSIPTAEERFITLDGRELIVETTAIPFTYRGEPAVQIIVKDITDKKRADETIRKTETLFSELFNSSPMAIVLLDSNGNVDRVNRGFEQMFGFTITELKGKSLNEFIVPKALTAEGNDLNSLISSNQVVRLETIRLRRDDTPLSVIIYGVPVHLEDQTIGIFGVYVDITEQKMIEEELKTRNAELDNFVYKVSHDLRAPLSSVLGLVNLAHLKGNEDDPRAYMKIIGEKVNQLDSFISDVLSHSKNLKMEIKRGLIHFEQIIESTFRDLNYMEGAQEMERQVSINGGDFYSDPWRMGEIFRNLVSNAIKYREKSEKHHLVKIDIRITADSARIMFTDNGIGIDEKDQEKIFEMFYRASEQSVGSGLGLYIVRNAVEKLGGKVRVESKPKTGTTFIIELPNRVGGI